jgi:hypothetical protein
MVVVGEHDLNKPFEPFVTEGGQELARVRSDLLILTQRKRNDCGAVVVSALADERDGLFVTCVVLFGLGVDLLVRVTKVESLRAIRSSVIGFISHPRFLTKAGGRMSTAEFASR